MILPPHPATMKQARAEEHANGSGNKVSSLRTRAAGSKVDSVPRRVCKQARGTQERRPISMRKETYYYGKRDLLPGAYLRDARKERW